MKLTVDKEADALYLKLKEGHIAHTKEVGDGIILDFGDKDELIGIEILWLSDRVPSEALANLNIELAEVAK
ncbi:MAG: DUF2283 domain-containing protein [Chloroflexi bacterium]|nr:DUF2283 domain-containing protein [Chloroflexota bacterium]